MNGLRSVLVGFLVLAAWSGLAHGESRAEVRDEAGLFTAQSVAKANKRLQALQKAYERDLVIETVKELSAAEHKKIHQATNRHLLAATFARISEARAQENNIHGVYIFISTDPSCKTLHVTAWPTKDAPLTQDDCTELYRRFVRRQQQGPNLALEDMVDTLDNLLTANLNPEPTFLSVHYLTLALIVSALLLLWGGGILLDARLKRATEADPSAGDATSSVRVLPGVLGGMFGNLAGHWIYDRAIRQGSAESLPSVNGSISTRGFPMPLGDVPPPRSDEGEPAFDPVANAEAGQP